MWLSAGSQASPPAHRVQDRRAVLLGKSLEVLGTALPAAGMYPLLQASAGNCGLLTAAAGPHASSPSSTTSHQPTRHELNRKTHVFPALAEARFRQGSQESKLKQQCHPEPVVRLAAGAGGGPTPSLGRRQGGSGTGEQGRGALGRGDTEQTLVREALVKHHAAASGRVPTTPGATGRARPGCPGRDAAAHCKNKPSGLDVDDVWVEAGHFLDRAHPPGLPLSYKPPSPQRCQLGTRCLLSQAILFPRGGRQRGVNLLLPRMFQHLPTADQERLAEQEGCGEGGPSLRMPNLHPVWSLGRSRQS